jgi:hypothetical protein
VRGLVAQQEKVLREHGAGGPPCRPGAEVSHYSRPRQAGQLAELLNELV